MEDVMLGGRTVTVWDPAVRIGHWLLVFAFAAAYLTGEGENEVAAGIVHIWAGYGIGVIVVLRVLWGLIGPRHARFTDFVYRPAKVLSYLLALLRGHARRYIGHSPAGGAMAVALLICLVGTSLTGLVALGDPSDVSLAGKLTIVSPAFGEAERAETEGGKSLVAELHATLANLTLVLIVLHVLGVVLASVAHRENLAKAMIDGRKRPAD